MTPNQLEPYLFAIIVLMVLQLIIGGTVLFMLLQVISLLENGDE